MFLDAATLHDLDVVSTSAPRGPTIRGLLDRTRTRVGRQQLRQRLVAAPNSAGNILALQQAHQALAAQAHAYRAAVDRADPDGVEQYLNSDWQLPADMRGFTPLAGRLCPLKWFRQYLRDVGAGQSHVLALLEATANLRSLLCSDAAPVLRAVGDRMAALIDTPEARELVLLGTRRSTASQRSFDQLARGSARACLTHVLDCVGAVEAMWSLAVATREHGWTYPRPGSRLIAKGLVHPFLGQNAVPNDLELDDRVRVCFMTGPNMAGKSTFLKAIAVAMLLAHAGCGVPAASMEFPTVGTVFSSVHIVDNLSAGESFYLAEVRRIRALAVALQNHQSAVAVIDEPFRGTNVHDAAEATLAVITRLAAHQTALVFIASHIGEIVPAIIEDPRIHLVHFAADITTNRPQFDYRLREGVSTQRLGMTLLRQEHVLELLERSAETGVRA